MNSMPPEHTETWFFDLWEIPTKIEIHGIRMECLIVFLCIETEDTTVYQEAGIPTRGTNLHIIKCRFSSSLCGLWYIIVFLNTQTSLLYRLKTYNEPKMKDQRGRRRLVTWCTEYADNAASVGGRAISLVPHNRCCVISFWIQYYFVNNNQITYVWHSLHRKLSRLLNYPHFGLGRPARLISEVKWNANLMQQGILLTYS